MSNLGREKVLLNLKWFVHRLLQSFEQKLENSFSHIRSPQSQSLSSVVCETCTPGNYTSSPTCIAHVPRSNFFQGTSSENVNKGQIWSPKLKVPLSNESSPLMGIRMRSLTNSPIFRRLSMLGYSQQQKFLSPSKKAPNKHCREEHQILNGHSVRSPSAASIGSPSIHSRRLQMQCSLKTFYSNSTKEERNFKILKFAQNLSVVYEYQLGMLQGMNAVHAAADYIADFLLNAIQLEKITDLSPQQLTPALLYNQECRPKTYSKCVKTCPLPVTCELLTWRLGEMWTLSGVRHNEVGGENCHNLSIVTHFIVADAGPKEGTRSDLYGYRNLIIVPKLEDQLKSLIESSQCLRMSSGDHELESGTNGVHTELTTKNSYYELCQHDHDLLTNSKVNTGAREENNRSRDKPENYDGSGKYVTDSPKNSPRTPNRRSVAMNSASTIRQHLHRAYRSVFFVIFNRSSVIEHLIECDSFAAFCKRQSLSPVMFLNEPTGTYDTRSYPCIYQNFNIFNVTVNGYVKTSNLTTAVPFDDVKGEQECQNQTRMPNVGKQSVMSFQFRSPKLSSGYDNQGFAC